TVNGGAPITSFSNNLDESTHGIAGLSFTPTAAGVETVNVSGNPAPAKAAIQEFVDKFNNVQKYIDTHTKITSGPNGVVSSGVLASDREVGAIGRSLRSTVFDAVPGM